MLPAWLAGVAALVAAIIRIVIWAIVVIALIVFAFAMISCLWSMAGGISIMPHR
jgi:hypothetical protein